MIDAAHPTLNRTLLAGLLGAAMLAAFPAQAAEKVRQVLPGGQATVASQTLTREAAADLPTGSTVKPDDQSDVERFCSNIADAAKDRRYALQTEELKQLQGQVDDRIKALEAKRAEYESWLKRREVFLARAEDGVVKIYTNMKPDAAAERLANLDVDIAAAIMMKLDPRKASLILNEMDDKAAAALTTIMVSAARRTDPS
jgi:flagellar motility protein MotE (MotC chaperone)